MKVNKVQKKLEMINKLQHFNKNPVLFDLFISFFEINKSTSFEGDLA